MNSIDEAQEEEEDDDEQQQQEQQPVDSSSSSSLSFQSSNNSNGMNPLLTAATSSSATIADHDMGESSDLLNGDVMVITRGVLFSRSIRSTYACLHLYPFSDQENSSSSDDEEDNRNENHDKDELRLRLSATKKPLLLRLQLEDRNHEALSKLRSHVRRQFKMGDLLCIVQQQAAPVTTTTALTNNTTTPLITDDGQAQAHEEDRVILHISSISDICRDVRVEQYQYWKMGRVQQVQAAHRQFLVGQASNHYQNNNNTRNNQTNNKKAKINLSEQQQHPRFFADSSTTLPEGEEEENGGGCYSHHGGTGEALEKRKLALYVANFVVYMTMNQIVKNKTRSQNQHQQDNDAEDEDYVGLDPSRWAMTCPWQVAPHDLVQEAIEQLNSSKKTTIKAKQLEPSNSDDNGTTPTTITCTEDSCDDGGGVLDVAGGSGLVSMALGLLFGVRSTVVDPRPSVGKLSRRDRKVYQRAILKGNNGNNNSNSHRSQIGENNHLEEKQLQNRQNDSEKKNVHGNSGNNQITAGGKQQQQQQQLPEQYGDFWSSRPLYCQPVQFDTRRAWFGERILASTSTNDPQPELSVMGQIPSIKRDGSTGNDDDGHENDSLLSSCSVIVALHPDQATDAVVEVALRHEIPFVVVPCCVFSRLFPHRRRRQLTSNRRSAFEDNLHNENEQQPVDLTVNTRLELIQYLQEKDDRIHCVDLPFIGANTVLWCTF